MARIAHCEFKDGGCDDGRCKIGACVMQNREDARSGEEVRRSEMAAMLADRRGAGAVGVTEERIVAALNDPAQSELARELFRTRRKIFELTERLNFRNRLTGEDH